MDKDTNVNIPILLRYGRIMLESNYSTNEIRNNLAKMARFIGTPDYSFYITETAIVLINTEDNEVKMVHVNNNSYDLEKITLVEKQIELFYFNKINSDILYHKLKDIDEKVYVFPHYVQIISAGVISGAAYCMFNEFTLVALYSGLIGAFSYFIYIYFQKYFKIQMLSILSYSLCVAVISSILYRKGAVSDSFSVILGGLMPLLPGSVVVNAIKATINSDYITGMSQCIYAFNTISMLVFPVVFILTTF